MPLSTITSKGQITVPKEVRDVLGLKAGDKVDFRLEKDGTARMLPLSRKVSDVFGMLANIKKKRPVTVREMDKNLKKAIKKKNI
jgi:AbrB family looped-hinge helix DNA binding protein